MTRSPQGTPEENKSAAQRTLAFYSPYSIVDKVVILTVDGSSYPNWTGGEQKRTVTSFSKDDLTWTNSAGSGGGLVELIARRVK
jgi:Lipocalin-like domain